MARSCCGTSRPARRSGRWRPGRCRSSVGPVGRRASGCGRSGSAPMAPHCSRDGRTDSSPSGRSTTTSGWSGSVARPLTGTRAGLRVECAKTPHFRWVFARSTVVGRHWGLSDPLRILRRRVPARRAVRSVAPSGRRRARRARRGSRRAPSLPPPAGVDSCAALLAYEGAGPGAGRPAEVPQRPRRRCPSSPGRLAALVGRRGGRSTSSPGPPPPPPGGATGASTRPSSWPGPSPGASARGVACRRLLLRPPGPAQTGQSLERPPGGARLPPRPARRRRGSSWSTTSSPAGRRWPPRPGRCGRPGPSRSTWWPRARTAPPAAPDAHPWPGLHSECVAVCGSVVESRRQSQAKRPT